MILKILLNYTKTIMIEGNYKNISCLFKDNCICILKINNFKNSFFPSSLLSKQIIFKNT